MTDRVSSPQIGVSPRKHLIKYQIQCLEDCIYAGGVPADSIGNKIEEREAMNLAQSIFDFARPPTFQSVTAATTNSKRWVLSRSDDVVRAPVAVAVVVGILMILTLIVCLSLCIWLVHRSTVVSPATIPRSPGMWAQDHSPIYPSENNRTSIGVQLGQDGSGHGPRHELGV